VASELTLSNSETAKSAGLVRKIRQLRLPCLPILVMFVLLVCAAMAPVLANSDPKAVNMVDSRIAPFETLSHPLGTDIVGRDMMTRLVYGTRTTVFISLVWPLEL